LASAILEDVLEDPDLVPEMRAQVESDLEVALEGGNCE
jgi:hypothetical protein